MSRGRGDVYKRQMEVLNEYGAVKYFGVNTFTSGIFRSWHSMQDVGTASLLAVSFFLLIVSWSCLIKSPMTVSKLQEGGINYVIFPSSIRIHHL